MKGGCRPPILTLFCTAPQPKTLQDTSHRGQAMVFNVTKTPHLVEHPPMPSLISPLTAQPSPSAQATPASLLLREPGRPACSNQKCCTHCPSFPKGVPLGSAFGVLSLSFEGTCGPSPNPFRAMALSLTLSSFVHGLLTHWIVYLAYCLYVQ